jgi:NAD(P)H-dependent FMN reductase
MDERRYLNIPVILGTTRKGRASVHAANLLAELLNRRAGVLSKVIDIAALPLPVDDAGEAIKSPAFSSAMAAADGLVIVAPEYNHSFPGLLKHALDSCLNEYIHKAVGLVGVSAFAGIRVVQGLLPVMRELGLGRSSGTSTSGRSGKSLRRTVGFWTRRSSAARIVSSRN